MNPRLTGLTRTVAWARRWLGRLVVVALLAPMAAGAALLTEPDASAVRKVIRAQLEALAANDAERAFSYASTSIRAQFGDSAAFMAMVRSGYPMVVRPAAVAFLQAQVGDDAQAPVSQPVQLRDRAGRTWRATYLLERQDGAGWRISGCVVEADSAQSLI